MPPQPLSPIRKAWYKWKSLHLPWRKRFLVGLDLQNNTFWEFRDTLSSHKHRMRRIVQYPPSTHLSDIHISPQWHQWLRHTRADAPSLQEQSMDIVRQERLKVLAADADRRWAAKPSFLDRPAERSQPVPALGGLDLGSALKVPGGVGGGGGELGEGQGVKDSERPQDLAKESNGEISAQKPTSALEQSSDRRKNPFDARSEGSTVKEKKYREDPWKQARGAPSETWQPQAWSPNTAATKR